MKDHDDKTTKYAILSHRWGAEVSYEEMTGLMKMEGRKRDEVRQRGGYHKIIKSCEQAMKDGYEWLWSDTCCIDKRSSAELSEAINSMYRWYRNAHVCYAYLHDVDESDFPTRPANKFSKSNGWPEWFARGWTLQELVAPKQLEFFNKDWVCIGNKRRLAPILEDITRIPIEVLRDGLGGAKNLGVAQIMSWAADRKTTRVEDRAYSLLGLFDVSMPMLYGDGNKAFHRLQLEIIRWSRGVGSSRRRMSQQEQSTGTDTRMYGSVCVTSTRDHHHPLLQRGDKSRSIPHNSTVSPHHQVSPKHQTTEPLNKYVY
ncbi:heterokaryon incompatibility protein-domain-containing protein [Pisolithus marmoratus]|nr:heterokaryon incompatibility protein-domain-containing protein [Pisolithus marmoratus]